MSFRITKDFTFSAAHSLDGLPEGHPCSFVHGHNYGVRVVLEAASVRGPGFVRDYGELGTFATWLKNEFDHRWLGYGVLARITNAESPGSLSRPAYGPAIRPAVSFNPTAENLAAYLYGILNGTLGFPEVISVGVSETDKTFAWFDDMEKYGMLAAFEQEEARA